MTTNKNSILYRKHPKDSLKQKETILVIAAHGNAPAFGAGGTLAKYAKEGKQIRTIIFSYGELSQPHLKPEIITKTKQREATKADKILGGDRIEYFGLKDTTMLIDIRRKETAHKLIQMIEHEKPTKIFTHGPNDINTYHYSVHQLIKKLIKEQKINCPVYSFDMLNPIKLTKRNLPKLIIDITDTFNTKIEAIKAHKSQSNTYKSMGWLIHLKAKMNGWHNNCKYAEIFDKIN